MSRNLKIAIIIFFIFRILFSLWALVSLQINPLPGEPDEILRPYLNQPILSEGQAGIWLGPWQRFDALRYTSIAANGYANEAESVFPPLYPVLSRWIGAVFGGTHVGHLIGGILISNIATVTLFWLMLKIGATFLPQNSATRGLVYYALFPASFFLFAPYTESLFILCAIGAIWQAKNGRILLAGLLGLVAALTRLTGIVLIVPLFMTWWENQDHPFWPLEDVWHSVRKLSIQHWLTCWPVFLPGLGTGFFFLYRNWLGLRPLSEIYQQYWFQTTNLPGSDVWRAIESMFFGGASRAGEITLWIDFLTLLFLVYTTYWVFKRLGAVWGMYNLLLIAFILLPTSELKPLYSFSRYALAFVPTFWVMAEAGERPFINRIILYTSLPLLLYLSGQFFIWGWVA